MNLYHGIGAYSGQKNPLALRRQLDAALEGCELCVAERPIGAFGAVLYGRLTVLFSRDVWSRLGGFVPDEGRNYWHSDVLVSGEGRSVVVDQDEILIGQDDVRLDDQDAVYAAIQSGRDGRYCEGWMQPVAARSLWVKDWADLTTKRAAAILARHRNLPLHVVSGKTRIWEYLDRHQSLPFHWRTAA